MNWFVTDKMNGLKHNFFVCFMSYICAKLYLRRRGSENAEISAKKREFKDLQFRLYKFDDVLVFYYFSYKLNNQSLISYRSLSLDLFFALRCW